MSLDPLCLHQFQQNWHIEHIYLELMLIEWGDISSIPVTFETIPGNQMYHYQGLECAMLKSDFTIYQLSWKFLCESQVSLCIISVQSDTDMDISIAGRCWCRYSHVSWDGTSEVPWVSVSLNPVGTLRSFLLLWCYLLYFAWFRLLLMALVSLYWTFFLSVRHSIFSDLNCE